MWENVSFCGFFSKDISDRYSHKYFDAKQTFCIVANGNEGNTILWTFETCFAISITVSVFEIR